MFVGYPVVTCDLFGGRSKTRTTVVGSSYGSEHFNSAILRVC